ncbi:hypothetical protein, partial [Mesorhizobium sp.]|uniref:hypothetical protein n=1 Tax=Mesorhizobium sp. TaxID=1871066 RepID=UPI0025FEF5F8
RGAADVRRAADASGSKSMMSSRPCAPVRARGAIVVRQKQSRNKNLQSGKSVEKIQEDSADRGAWVTDLVR